MNYTTLIDKLGDRTLTPLQGVVNPVFGKTDFVKVCREVSEEIMQLLAKSRARGERLDQKMGRGADGEPAYQVDVLAEEKALEAFKQLEFRGRIITEERGTIQFGESEDTIWLDPIDGTRNAYRNVPYYALSIALFRKTTFKEGYIRNLANEDEFIGQKGIVTYNGTPVKTVSRPLDQVGITVSRPQTQKGFIFLHFLQQRVRFIRILGAAALDIVYLASGAMDAFLDLDRGLKSVDYGAAQPLLECAGGVVSDLRGQPIKLHEDLTIRAQILAASNKKLHSILIGLLKEFEYVY